MKNIKTTLVLALLTLSVHAQTWSIDYAHSSINFSINHFFTPVIGKFQRFTGALQFNPDQPENSKIEFTVAVASVNTDNAKRDNDLRSTNFFDEKKYPKMFFVSSRFEKKSDNQYIAYGKMTIRDVTKDIEIPFTLLGRGDHPMKQGMQIIGIKAEFKLARTKYGVGNGSWAATAIVGDEVSAIVVLEASAKK